MKRLQNIKAHLVGGVEIYLEYLIQKVNAGSVGYDALL